MVYVYSFEEFIGESAIASVNVVIHDKKGL